MPPVSFSLQMGSDAGMAGPSGPVVNERAFRWVRGDSTLVAGAVNVVLTVAEAEEVGSNPQIVLTADGAGGAAGFLQATWTPGTRTLAITSSSGTDTRHIQWSMLSLI